MMSVRLPPHVVTPVARPAVTFPAVVAQPDDLTANDYSHRRTGGGVAGLVEPTHRLEPGGDGTIVRVLTLAAFVRGYVFTAANGDPAGSPIVFDFGAIGVSPVHIYHPCVEDGTAALLLTGSPVSTTHRGLFMQEQATLVVPLDGSTPYAGSNVPVGQFGNIRGEAALRVRPAATDLQADAYSVDHEEIAHGLIFTTALADNGLGQDTLVEGPVYLDAGDDISQPRA